MVRWPVLLLAVFALGMPFLEAQRPGRARRKGRAQAEGVQPYDKVISEAAKTQKGVFLVHQVGKKLYYEIPPAAFEKPFLWVIQIEKTQAGFGYGGTAAGRRVVRWQLRGETVLLRDVHYRLRATKEDPVRYAVEATSLEPILAAFPVKAWGKDRAPVIEVTDLFLDGVPELSPRRRLNAASLDRKRSFLEKVKAFPLNIETKVLATYTLRSAGAASRRRPTPSPPRRRRPRPRGDPSQSAVTVLVHHSMVQLPERPMKPRRYDERVGFFTVSFEDYGTDRHQVETVRYITRWRLEKKNPQAPVSEPKKPIVFYVGRGVPAKWRPYVKKGIEMWQPAFEAAGFKKAIIARDAPDPREDPDWDAEDARYSTIRWLPATIENAMGPHVHDPRTGEILEADIIVYHNVLKLVRDWYFVQASPCDPRAQKLPLPDDLVGELLAYVVAHEVGHSLGFPHNMKASSAFTVAQLRDPAFTRKWGTEASIMDYGRFNYVAQPGDGARLIPKIGPYDYFAVEWGYREYPDEKAERRGLAKLLARQKEDPTLRFGGPNAMEDPTQQTEDLGSDPVAATELGLKNLKRVAGYLVQATCRPGKDYSLLENMYEELLQQRGRELGHVAALVGGVVKANLFYGDADRRFTPVPAAKQRQAVAFLVQHGFHVPPEFVQPDILDRLEAAGVADRILAADRRLLRTLVNETRIKRMAEHAARPGAEVYRPAEFLRDLTRGIWSELAAKPVRIGLFRRNLQRAYTELLAGEVKKETVRSDLPALARAELEELAAALRGAVARAADDVTRAHLKDQLARIERALKPGVPEKTASPRA